MAHGRDEARRAKSVCKHRVEMVWKCVCKHRVEMVWKCVCESCERVRDGETSERAERRRRRLGLAREGRPSQTARDDSRGSRRSCFLPIEQLRQLKRPDRTRIDEEANRQEEVRAQRSRPSKWRKKIRLCTAVNARLV